MMTVGDRVAEGHRPMVSVRALVYRVQGIVPEQMRVHY